QGQHHCPICSSPLRGRKIQAYTHVNTMVSFSGACLLCLRGYLPGLWATRGQRIYSHYKQKKAVHLQGLVVVHGKCHCWCWEDSDDGNPACARTS
ncbi:hypothetical protein STEG23_029456, partial [Scotinomys teguina]